MFSKKCTRGTRRVDSNHRPSVFMTAALPLSYLGSDASLLNLGYLDLLGEYYEIMLMLNLLYAKYKQHNQFQNSKMILVQGTIS